MLVVLHALSSGLCTRVAVRSISVKRGFHSVN